MNPVRPDRVRAAWRSEGGFSLLEILVAFSIMGIALGIVMRIFGGNSERVAIADEYSRATIIAESLMAAWGVAIPATPGDVDGEEGKDDNAFRWRISATVLREPPPFEGLLARDIQNDTSGIAEISNSLLPEAERRRQANQGSSAEPPPFILYRLTAEVAWGDEDAPRNLVLTSLRMGANPEVNQQQSPLGTPQQ